MFGYTFNYHAAIIMVFAAYIAGFLKFSPYLLASWKVWLNGREGAAIENCGKFAKK